MNVLLIGSGGREHALAWKLAQSPHMKNLWIAPGNPGTARFGRNANVKVDDVKGLVEFSRFEKIDVAVIGPEAALEAGVADALSSAGILVFGPTQAAAQIETSKSFSKEFMQRHGIPTARFAVFKDLAQAQDHLEQINYPVVIKASGLAAGKGVIIPRDKEEAKQALQDILEKHAFGRAGEEVIIEEYLIGEEVSLLAFCDGRTIVTMPPAQDHKRLLDGDQGPNTGGMGAYAPAPICPPELQREIADHIIQPAVDGLREEGMPFIGVLYTGLILTADGPRVLEFNARFGDPETQVILPLLKTDLLDLVIACAQGRLHEIQVEWSSNAAVCVVMASAGYPMKSSPVAEIHGLENLSKNCVCFQAGTGEKDGRLWATGGRVLGIIGLAGDIPQAVQTAYEGIGQIHFEGAQYRRDICHAVLNPAPLTYRSSGVDIDSGARAVNLIRHAVSSTYTPRVLAGIGSFGGLFDAVDLLSMKDPILVASTDGVGTKVKLAASLGRYRGIGMDIVNHCINDILVQGARPLFFLDYFATSKLRPEILAEIVEGISEACREAGCVLLGGETAEMPGVYETGEFDLAGTIVGCVERARILPKQGIRVGDLLVGIRSSGPHTNGYSLLRKIFEGEDLQAQLAGSQQTLADALLAPHRSYLNLLLPIINRDDSPIEGLAHLTGGGFLENIPRILPEGLGAQIKVGAWPVLPIFNAAQQKGRISAEEMHRVFNMGIGMVVVVKPSELSILQSAITETTWVVGEIIEDSQKKVRLV